MICTIMMMTYIMTIDVSQEAMKDIQKVMAEQEGILAELDEAEQSIQKEQIEVNYQLETWNSKVKECQQRVKHWNKELGRLELHKVDGLAEAQLKPLTPEELAEVDTDDTQYQITLLEEKNQKLNPNMAAIQEYKRKVLVYLIYLH